MIQSNSNKGSKLCICLMLYLSFFEFALKTSIGGSALKYVSILAIILFLLTTFRANNKVSLSSLSLAAIIWEIVSCISIIWSRDSSMGFYYIKSVLLSICILIVIQNVTWEDEEKTRIIDLYVIFCTVYAAVVFFGSTLYHGTGIRYSITVFGVEADPNNVAAMIAPCIVICLYKILKTEKLFIFVPCIILSVLALFKTASRGGFVSCIVGAFILLLLDTIYKRKSIKRLLFTSIIVMVLLLIIVKYVTRMIDANLIERLMNTSSYDNGSNRLQIWSTALDLLKNESPIIGRGIGSALEPISHAGVHNMYLSVLCDVSLFSLVPFLCMFYCVIKRAKEEKNALVISIVVCMMVAIFFLDAYPSKYMWNVFFISAIMLNKRIA